MYVNPEAKTETLCTCNVQHSVEWAAMCASPSPNVSANSVTFARGTPQTNPLSISMTPSFSRPLCCEQQDTASLVNCSASSKPSAGVPQLPAGEGHGCFDNSGEVSCTCPTSWFSQVNRNFTHESAKHHQNYSFQTQKMDLLPPVIIKDLKVHNSTTPNSKSTTDHSSPNQNAQ